MTKPITPISCFIYEKYLYNFDKESNLYIPCEIIGISAYLNQPLTFHVLIEKHSMFSDIPVHALIDSRTTQESISNDSLSFINCPDENIDVFVLKHLVTKHAYVFFKKEDRWLKAKYEFTIDFYKDNELVHLMLLDNGQFAFVPNHKVNWNDKQELPNYKKLKQNWSL